jgi:glycine/D-amino acid oxidase-like deaminating enzyme
MEEPIGIIGAGITGLATAYVLSSNHKVTIIARDLPGDLGLNWASPWFVNSFRFPPSPTIFFLPSFLPIQAQI